MQDTYSATGNSNGAGLGMLQLNPLTPTCPLQVGSNLSALSVGRAATLQDQVTSSFNYTIPMSGNTRWQLTLDPTNQSPVLSVDVDGNGTTDFLVPPNSQPPPTLFPAVLLNAVETSGLPPAVTAPLAQQLGAAIADLNSGDTSGARTQLAAFSSAITSGRGTTIPDSLAGGLGDIAIAGLDQLLSPTPTASPTLSPTSTQTSTQTETATPTPPPCTGDCNGDSSVTVDELLKMVNIALGNQPVANCAAGDQTRNGEITIDEIIAAVNKVLNGCGG